MRSLNTVLSLAVTLSLFHIAAAEDRTDAAAPVVEPGLKKYVGELMPLFFALGKGDVETASKMLDKHLYYPDFNDNFGGKQVAIDAHVSHFKDWRLDFESVDFMQYKRLSSQGYTVMLVANGSAGPTMFALTVYHHRGKWQLNEFTFQLAAAQYRAAFPNVALPNPITYRSSDYVEVASGGRKAITR